VAQILYAQELFVPLPSPAILGQLRLNCPHRGMKENILWQRDESRLPRTREGDADSVGSCPPKKNRVRPARQDGRPSRRYRRRWIVERTIGWLGNYRRVVVRYDRSLQICRGSLHIACFMIVLLRVVQ